MPEFEVSHKNSNSPKQKTKLNLIWVDIDKIKLNNYNPNVMNAEKFEALCDFLKTHSAEELDPVWIRQNGVHGFEIIDGEHRWKAAKAVGWKRLRAFVIALDEDGAKAFNVRKNRERGQLNPFKLGRIFLKEYEVGVLVEVISQKYGYLVNGKKGRASVVYNLLDIAKHEKEIVDFLKKTEDSATVEHCSYKKALHVLDELKHPQQEESENSQQLTSFLTNYAKALKKNPLPNVQKDEMETAIEFFKRLLAQKKVMCPICGEAHLQWRCGHEF